MSPFVIRAARAATLDPAAPDPYGLLEDAALVVADGSIAWVGPAADLPAPYVACEDRDYGDRLLTPAPIDCHTHLVFGGDRAREFEMRLEGASYEEIAREGGGILSTMRATRAADEEELVRTALPRLDALLAEGVCRVEIKSGYGLTVEDELKMLRVARELGARRDVHVTTTWLAAHAVPPEYSGRGDAYLDEVVLAGLARAHAEGLVDAVDAFCEGIAFSPEQVARVFAAARAAELPRRIHAEQLSNLGGAALAASYGARSADHLERLDRPGAAALAAAGTVAVLLPGAFYTLRDTHVPPVGLLREEGVELAVASDGNPGSSPMFSVLLALNMACTLFRLTPAEALAGVTRVAAKVLGCEDRAGVLGPGMDADVAVWDVQHPAELSYRIGFNPLHERLIGGRPCA